ncbi:MAG: hypothetical protein B7733_16940 [Myxococcales bacterium FL481]|nr:MAG: hypothetical protein B7733_16940 [Myxococcales bacterium FL481]
MDDVELPKLYESELTAAQLRELFEDLAEVAEVLDVLLKGHPTERTDGRPVSLSDAREAVENRRVRGVQIRYRFDGSEWRDSLLIAPGRVKLVRMQMPELPPSAGSRDRS